MADRHPFLSDEWIGAARSLREEFAGGVGVAAPMRMNQVITDVPFGEGTINSHMDTTSGQLELEVGHLDSADVTVTLDYETAKAIFVEGNPQAGMQAFMAGKIKVQGDLTKLMAMQQVNPDPAAADLQQRIKDITA